VDVDTVRPGDQLTGGRTVVSVSSQNVAVRSGDGYVEAHPVTEFVDPRRTLASQRIIEPGSTSTDDPADGPDPAATTAADAVIYVPVEYHAVDFARMPDGSARRLTYDDGNPYAVHAEIHALLDGKRIGKVHWTPGYGNATVEVDPDHRRQGIGTRLMHEARTRDASAVEQSTPITASGQALGRRLGLDAIDGTPTDAPAKAPDEAVEPVDFKPTGQGDLAPAGVDAKVQANLAALRLLRRIEAEDRPATADEQQVLARFAGWGALPKVFVTGDDTYAPVREELRGLLSPAEYDDAMQNALNSHFTDAGLVEPMWAALTGLGFESGLVLEAGCGTGNFIGFAPAGARLVGVERNEVSGSIARLLYPSAEVRVESFGETPVRPGTYDAVIGNVPFGNYPVRDRVHNPRNQLLIHDHFISKSLAGLKPGGTMAVITSAGTLDKQLSTVRRGWFDQADLLGAVRLPNAAHRAAAGTEVVTDVLVLRRREPDRTPGDDAWVTSVPTRLDDGTERHINGYFAAHPENILGTTATGQAAMGREVLAVRPFASDGPLGSQLRERLEVIAAAALAEDRGHSPAATEPPSTQTSTAQTPAQASATPASPKRSTTGAPGPVRSARTLARAKKVGQITHTATEPVPGKRRGSAGSLRHSFTVVDFDGTEVPYVPDGAKTAGRRTKDGHHPSQADELVSLLRMRDLAADLREAERETAENTPEIDELRAELNRCYDTYVADYGPISRMKASQKQVTVKDPEDPNQTEGLVEGDDGEWYQITYTKPGMGGIRKDPTWWSLTGLEAAYDEFTNTATKAKFFTQRMVGFRELPVKAESPADAVAISREHDGRVDMDRIAGLLGVTLEEATSLTKGLVFTDHRTGDLVPAHLFLSGNVRRKAAELEELAKDDPDKWGEAAAAMRAAVPPDKDVTKISAKLGMVWIPATDVETFVRDITGNDRATVTYSEEDGWKCSPANGGSRRNPALEGGGSMGAPPGHDWRKPLKAKWGTSRRTTYQLVETALKGQRPQVTDKDSEGVERINRAETEAAGEQMEVIEKEFARWLWRDPDRKQRLHAAYNDKYRSYTDVNYVDSPYSAYPGMSDAIALDPHQNDAVAMAKDSEAVLLHHEVGTGKTFTLAASMMEKRRLGQIHKPVVVVPNHLLEQWVREFTILYPDAELLATDTKGISGPDARRRFVAQAASHDWDAVVMTASSFRLLPLSEETIEDNIQQRLDKLRGEREEALAEGDTKAVKRIGERIEREESSLRELQDRIGGDIGPLDFETAGFDYVVVDEAHEYKNDEVESSVRALAKGKPNLGAVDLRAKLDWLRERNAELGKRSVALFATGTPISNSTREFYVMIRFLRPDLLAEAGVSEFDDFRKAFLQMEESIEPTVTGRLQVKMREGDGLVNAGELKRIWVQFADEVTAEDVGLERPKLRGGQAEKILRGVSEHQQAFIRHLNVRREAIKPKFKPEPGEDTVVAIGTDGLTSAVDLRLIPKLKLWEAGIDPADLTDEDSKVPLVAEQVLAEWERTRDMEFTVRRGSAEPAPIRGGFQLVFCDKGVPNSEGKHSFYDALKFALVDGGLKPDEVAFIHDAEGDATKLGKLTERCRTGEIKVLIGSTGKMGTGLNVQNRLSALHHVDGAYRPDQIEQRNGRAIRRGNQFDEVRVLYYPLEGSTEGFQWAHVARKDNFLRAFALADLDATIIGQSESATQSEAAMLKALAANNPLLMDKTQLDLDLRRMQNQADTFDASKDYHANVVAQGTRMIESLTASITALEAAATEVSDTSGEAFRMFATNKYGRLEDRPVIERKHAALRLAASPGLSGNLDFAPLGEGRPFLIGKLGGVRLYAWTYRPGIGKASYRVGVDDPRNTREWAPDLLDLSPADLTPGKIDTGAITRLENLVRSINDRPAALAARVDRLRKEVEVSAAEQDTTFEAADELDALKERNRALTELMRLVAADRPSGANKGKDGAAEAPDAAESAASAGSASDDAARKHAALVAEAETTYNEATEKWRALRDARLEAPGNVKPAEMGAIRTSRRRIKQQMAERAREARGEPAPRPRIHARDASADHAPASASAPNGSRPSPRPAIAPPPPPASPPPPGFGGPTAGLGWSR
jgi:N12 class adenine-specific DNA methylase/GNAT superfamily N-acetyltransferase